MKDKLLKYTALILVASLSFVIVRFTVLGTQNVPESAYTYSLNGNEATITGCTAELSGAVMLPTSIDGYTVVGIGDKAFKNRSNVTCFFMPATVTTIGDYAFEGCTALLNASFPSTLVTIGEGAYWECSSLVSVTIPSTVTAIGTCAFYDCEDLESLVVLSSTVRVSGIFDVQLDIGEVIAFGAGVLTQPGDTSVPDVYCFSDSLAYNDLLECQFSNLKLLDDGSTVITAYTVNYVSDTGTTLYSSKTFSIQPAGIDVAEVAARVDGYIPTMNSLRTTLINGTNIITFTYETAPETTTASTTTTTTEPTTDEPTTEEPTTEEPTTEEPTTEEPTTEEPTTEEPTTEEPTTEEPTTEESTTEEPTTVPELDPVLFARANSGCVINESNKFIYGITPGVNGITEEHINQNFLGVTGNGYIRYTYNGVIGTNTTIQLVRSSDNVVLKTYKLVIFGDVNCDGYILQTDLTLFKGCIAGNYTYLEGSPYFFALDLNGDGMLLQPDYTLLKSVISGANTINQTTGEVIPVAG